MIIKLKNGNEYHAVTKIIFGKLGIFFHVAGSEMLQSEEYDSIDVVTDYGTEINMVEPNWVTGEEYLAKHLEVKH